MLITSLLTHGSQLKMMYDVKNLGSWIDNTEADPRSKSIGACNKLSNVLKSDLPRELKVRLLGGTAESIPLAYVTPGSTSMTRIGVESRASQGRVGVESRSLAGWPASSIPVMGCIHPGPILVQLSGEPKGHLSRCRCHSQIVHHSRWVVLTLQSVDRNYVQMCCSILQLYLTWR